MVNWLSLSRVIAPITCVFVVVVVIVVVVVVVARFPAGASLWLWQVRGQGGRG